MKKTGEIDYDDGGKKYTNLCKTSCLTTSYEKTIIKWMMMMMMMENKKKGRIEKYQVAIVKVG